MAQARPSQGQAPNDSFGPAWDFWKPKPPQARHFQAKLGQKNTSSLYLHYLDSWQLQVTIAMAHSPHGIMARQPGHSYMGYTRLDHSSSFPSSVAHAESSFHAIPLPPSPCCYNSCPFMLPPSPWLSLHCHYHQLDSFQVPAQHSQSDGHKSLSRHLGPSSLFTQFNKPSSLFMKFDNPSYISLIPSSANLLPSFPATTTTSQFSTILGHDNLNNTTPPCLPPSSHVLPIPLLLMSPLFYHWHQTTSKCFPMLTHEQFPGGAHEEIPICATSIIAMSHSSYLVFRCCQGFGVRCQPGKPHMPFSDS